MNDRPLRIELLGSSDDPPVNSPDFQEAMEPVGAALHSTGLGYTQRAIAFDSADVLGYPLPEYMIPLAQAAVTAASVALGAWLQGRAGRKVRLKIGDMEAEARTPEEVERLLDKAMQLKRDQSDAGS